MFCTLGAQLIRTIAKSSMRSTPAKIVGQIERTRLSSFLLMIASSTPLRFKKRQVSQSARGQPSLVA